jgi:hypothetical protein
VATSFDGYVAGPLRESDWIVMDPDIDLRARFDGSRKREPGSPADVDELCFHVPGVIEDIQRLKRLFDLFAVTLDQLCRVGSAYETAPEPEGARVRDQSESA